MSGPKPWDADRELDAESVRAAIRDAFPDVDADEVRHLGSGWEFDAWCTRDGWVFRFPRRRQVAEGLERETRILDLVRPAVAPLRVPRPERVGRPGAAFPYRFAGHRMVPGVPADTAGVASASRLAGTLGRALARLHALDPGSARRAGLRHEPYGSREYLGEADAWTGTAPDGPPAAVRAFAWLEAGPVPPPEPPAPPRVIHNDLCPDHILLDPATGDAAGLIDWTDAVLGDPAMDFARILPWAGVAFTRRAIDAYGLPLDPGAWDRVRFLGRIMSLVWLQHALEQDADPAALDKHARWLENAFSDEP